MKSIGAFFAFHRLPHPFPHSTSTAPSTSVKRRTSWIPSLTVLAWTIICSACGADAPAGPSFSPRDSAGIVIAENRGEVELDGSGWAISPDPVLQIGSVEGDDAYLFFRIWGAARLSDGRIAVVNNRAPDLRIFDAEGRHLRTFGQRGEGPEDFDSPLLAGTLPGDTLVIVDRLLRRLNLYHPDVGFVRGATATPDIEGYLLTEGMFSSGSVLIYRPVWTESMPNGLFRFPIQYYSVGLDGTLEHDFGEFLGGETIYAAREVEGGTMTMSSGRPFGKHPVVAVAGDRFFYGSQDAYEIQVWSQAGRLVRIIRRNKPPEPVTDAHVAALMEDMMDQADDSDQTRQFRRMFRDAPIPELHPALGSIYADASGFLWVEEYRVPGEETRVTTIFNPEGRMVGSVVLPSGLQVYEIGADYLLGRSVDDLGVEYLRLYSLTRPE